MALDAFEKLPQQRREYIINACLEVFARRDYKHASTDDMAARAGISKGLLFYYFRNKQELYVWLFGWAVELVRARMWELSAFEEEDFFDMLCRATRIKGEIMKDHPGLYDFLIQAYYETDPAVSARLGSVRSAGIAGSMAELRRRLPVHKLREGVDGELALKLLLWSAEGYMKLCRERDELRELDAIVGDYTAAMELLRRALYKEEYW